MNTPKNYTRPLVMLGVVAILSGCFFKKTAAKQEPTSNPNAPTTPSTPAETPTQIVNARATQNSPLASDVDSDSIDFAPIDGGYAILGSRTVNSLIVETLSRLIGSGAPSLQNLDGYNSLGLLTSGGNAYLPSGTYDDATDTGSWTLKKIGAASTTNVPAVSIAWSLVDTPADALVLDSDTSLWMGFSNNTGSAVSYSVRNSGSTSAAWSGTFGTEVELASGPVLAQKDGNIYAFVSGSTRISGSDDDTNRIKLAKLSDDGSVAPQTSDVAQTTSGSMFLHGAKAVGNFVYVWGLDGRGAFATRANAASLAQDNTYGIAGFASTSLRLANGFLDADVGDVDAEGRFVACGRVIIGSYIGAALWRFTASGVLDTSFGNSSAPFIKVRDGDAQCFRVRVLPNGSVAALTVRGFHGATAASVVLGIVQP